MRPSIGAVIFDLDGTLLDTEALYVRVDQTLCSRYGAEYTLALKRTLMGGDAVSNTRRIVAELGLPIDAGVYRAERERLLAELWPSAQPMPGALELIERLRASSTPIAIATSGHKQTTALKLAHHDAFARVPVIVCGDDARVVNGKPAPDIFLAAADELGVPPEVCAVLEDSHTGVCAGLAAGMHTLALVDARWGFPESAFAAAAHRVSTLHELTAEMLGI